MELESSTTKDEHIATLQKELKQIRVIFGISIIIIAVILTGIICYASLMNSASRQPVPYAITSMIAPIHVASSTNATSTKP